MSLATDTARELTNRTLGSARLSTGRCRLELWGNELVGWNCTEGRATTEEELTELCQTLN